MKVVCLELEYMFPTVAVMDYGTQSCLIHFHINLFLHE